MRTALFRLLIAAWVCCGVGLVVTAPRAQFSPPTAIITSGVSAPNLPLGLTLTDSGTANGGTYSFGAGGYVVVAVAIQTGQGGSLNSVTVGGGAATKLVSIQNLANPPPLFPITSIWIASGVSAGSGVISVNVTPGSGGSFAQNFAVYNVGGISSQTPFATASANSGSAGHSITQSISYPANGIVLGLATDLTATAPTWTWTNLTKQGDLSGVNGMYSTSAKTGPNASPGSVSATAAASIIASNAGIALVMASWGP